MKTNKLKVLDLFSGIGGFSLGLERTGGFETVAFCEIDPFCQKVLAKHWPEVSVYNDVRTLDYEGPVDVITGGYPCQPFSLAGKQKGKEDNRHLWPFMFDLVKKHRPAWVIGENVAGHINVGLDDVLADLESAVYAVRAFVIPACAVDAKHRRDRVWIVAYNDSQRQQPGTKGRDKTGDGSGNSGETLADGLGAGLEGHAGDGKNRSKPRRDRKKKNRPVSTGGICGTRNTKWQPEPGVGRVAHGVSIRVDRLKGLGNAVVPQIPEIIGNAILQAEFHDL